jgi:ketosteroid isomerase-like protein
LLAVSAEDIEWIVPGKGWPLAGKHRGHAGLTDLLQKASETVETSYPTPFEFVAQGDRVLASASRRGKCWRQIRRSRTTGSSPLPSKMAS